MTNERSGRGNRDSNLTIAAILILAGLVALVAQLAKISLQQYMWPFWVLAPGVVLVALGLGNKGKSAEGLTVLGSLVAGAGLVLFLQNLTGLWASWAYAWALVAPGAVGLGQVIYGSVKDEPAKTREGWRALRAGLWLFGIGFVFFELVLGISGFGLGHQYWPVALIILGVAMLLRNMVFRQRD